MKKIISTVLIFVLLFGSAGLSATGLSTPDEDWFYEAYPFLTRDDYLFMERYFGDDLEEIKKGPDPRFSDWEWEWAFYDELYYHYDEKGEIDWAFIRANKYWGHATGYYTRIGKYFITNSRSYNEFKYGIGLYDVKKDKFVDVFDPAAIYYADYTADYEEKYDEIMEGLEYIKDLGHRRTKVDFLQAGDADDDGELTVIDATCIQRYLAGMSIPVYDKLMKSYDDISPSEVFDFYYGGVIVSIPGEYMLDFDNDKEITVLDATHIQRALAGLE